MSSLDTHSGDIQGTTLSRIRTAIADGMAQGNSARDIGTAINAVINDPARADMIAVTETNTSYNAGAYDTYVEAGIPGWEWIAYEGACETCLSLEGFHDISDSDFPSDASHPNCRCGISPVTEQSGDTSNG
jgi:SPP1 gp7 family putative phage head morphogenesis protein